MWRWRQEISFWIFLPLFLMLLYWTDLLFLLLTFNLALLISWGWWPSWACWRNRRWPEIHTTISLSSHQLPIITPQLEMDPHESLPSPCQNYGLAWSCAGITRVTVAPVSPCVLKPFPANAPQSVVGRPKHPPPFFKKGLLHSNSAVMSSRTQ